MVPDTALSVSLTDAAFQAGLSYQRMLTEVLCGQVEGFREEGRWRVNAKSLADYCSSVGVTAKRRQSRKAYYNGVMKGLEELRAQMVARMEEEAAKSTSE